ncbi:MAG: FHA domain-containing protein [Coriobacteriia bacterium]|nr:FHA domain-containing protein [Coriobacteriia bacterium]
MFRSPVQPAELARAASKEMTRSRKLGLDKMYVANVYFVFISPRDANTMGDLLATIEGELETYLLAFARERDYSFVTRPVVRFSVDDQLKRQGKFDIIGQQMTAEAIYMELGSVAGVTDALEAERGPSPAAYAGMPATQVPPIAATPLPELLPDEPALARPVVDPWADAPLAAAPIVPAAVPDQKPDHPVTAVVADEPTITRVGSVTLPDQNEIELSPDRAYITGRQSTCDLPVNDANISRQHAEFFWDGEGWSLRDLGSTNGTSINGHKISSNIELHDGDQITMGMSTLIYHETTRMV